MRCARHADCAWILIRQTQIRKPNRCQVGEYFTKLATNVTPVWGLLLQHLYLALAILLIGGGRSLTDIPILLKKHSHNIDVRITHGNGNIFLAASPGQSLYTQFDQKNNSEE